MHGPSFFRKGCIFFLLHITLVACISSKQQANLDMHTSQSSLDWAGWYQGLLPCADCLGIETIVQLHADNTYQLSQQHTGKTGRSSYTGIFSWEANGNKITISDNKQKFRFQVSENKLFWLDRTSKKIKKDMAIHYILTKHENNIQEKYWKLAILKGDSVATDSNNREAHIILRQDGAQFKGYAGCNAISGSYALKEQNGIRFSRISSTDRACDKTALEQKMIDMLLTVNTYTQHGDTLYLQQEKMVPLAKFEAVYFR